MANSEAGGNIVAVLKVMDASLPVVAELIRVIKAVAARNGVDVNVEIRDLETDALKTINETERILDDVSGVK